MAEITPAPTNTSNKSHAWVWALIVILILIALGVVTCTWAFKAIPKINLSTSTQSRSESGISDSDLALALIAREDVSLIDGLDEVRPSTIELNDHLDDTLPDTYSFYVARSWSTVPDGELKLSTALVKNKTAADAQTFLDVRSAGKAMLNGAPDLGDSTVMYYEPAFEGAAPSVTIRFTRNTLAAKVQVFATETIAHTAAEIQAVLIPKAKTVAQAQADRLNAFMANTLAKIEKTPSLLRVPQTIPGTKLVGTIPVSEEEWFGVTGDFSQDANIPGLVDGAMSRFLINTRPEEVVEVTVFQFLTNSLAEAFQQELLVDPDLTGSTEVELSGDLADAADALVSENIAEMQIVKENYVIDVSLFSPFGTLDMAAGQVDLVTMGQYLYTHFSAE